MNASLLKRLALPALFIVCGLVGGGMHSQAYAQENQSLSDLQRAGRLKIKTWIEPAQAIVVNQQINLAIEIASDQWFSGGTRIGRLEIDDAVVLRREQFAVNSTRREAGATWSVQLWSISIYPQREGVFEIPALGLQLSVAGEDGKPVTGKLYTERLSFAASVPEALAAELSPARDSWVASPVFGVEENYSQSHDRDLQELQAGDAVQRSITFKAENIAAMMLPALTEGEQQGLAIYQKPPRLNDDINRGVYQAQRTETITYVIEKPGDYVVPEQTYHWWDLSSQSLKSVTLPAQRISTAGVALAVGPQQTQKCTPYELGLLLTKIGVPLLLVMGIAFLLWRKRSRDATETVLVPGERALRKNLLQACEQGQAREALTLLYQWLDHYQGTRFDGSIRNLLQEMDQQELRSMFESVTQSIYAQADEQADVDLERFVGILVAELQRVSRSAHGYLKPVSLELN